MKSILYFEWLILEEDIYRAWWWCCSAAMTAPLIAFFRFLLNPLLVVGARYHMPRAPPLMFTLQLGMHVYDKAGDMVRKFAKPAHPETDPDHVVTLSRCGTTAVISSSFCRMMAVESRVVIGDTYGESSLFPAAQEVY